MEHFVEVCRRRGLKGNACKMKMMVLGGEERFEYVEHVLEFNLGCVLDESSTDEAECCRRVASGRRVAGAISSMVNARSL